VKFELKKPGAPLSWHLMPKQKADIVNGWSTDSDIKAARDKVARFLDGLPPAHAVVRKHAATPPSIMEAGASV
jgi:hypothetical protein